MSDLEEAAGAVVGIAGGVAIGGGDGGDAAGDVVAVRGGRPARERAGEPAIVVERVGRRGRVGIHAAGEIAGEVVAIAERIAAPADSDKLNPRRRFIHPLRARRSSTNSRVQAVAAA
jgi:hypothetical protein